MKSHKKEIDWLLDYKGKKINIELSNRASEGVIHRNEDMHVKYILGN